MNVRPNHLYSNIVSNMKLVFIIDSQKMNALLNNIVKNKTENNIEGFFLKKKFSKAQIFMCFIWVSTHIKHTRVHYKGLFLTDLLLQGRVYCQYFQEFNIYYLLASWINRYGLTAFSIKGNTFLFFKLHHKAYVYNWLGLYPIGIHYIETKVWIWNESSLSLEIYSDETNTI